MRSVYDQREVSRLTGVSESQIRYWDRTGLIPHVEKDGGVLFFDFKGLVSFRAVKELLGKGVSLRRIRGAVRKFRDMHPDAGEPLKEINISNISLDGGRVVLCSGERKFTTEGQLLINFGVNEEPAVFPPVDASEDLFFQALEHAQRGETGEAKRKYEAVLSMRPDHTDALVNLGNIEHGRGSDKAAERCYRMALRLDPCHTEANYNFANILVELGNLKDAVLFYTRAVHDEPEFADAHFNLGLVLERLGERGEARRHWLRYLEFDPHSEWAETVKSLLGM